MQDLRQIAPQHGLRRRAQCRNADIHGSARADYRQRIPAGKGEFCGKQLHLIVEVSRARDGTQREGILPNIKAHVDASCAGQPVELFLAQIADARRYQRGFACPGGSCLVLRQSLKPTAKARGDHHLAAFGLIGEENEAHVVRQFDKLNPDGRHRRSLDDRCGRAEFGDAIEIDGHRNGGRCHCFDLGGQRGKQLCLGHRVRFRQSQDRAHRCSRQQSARRRHDRRRGQPTLHV